MCSCLVGKPRKRNERVETSNIANKEGHRGGTPRAGHRFGARTACWRANLPLQIHENLAARCHRVCDQTIE